MLKTILSLLVALLSMIEVKPQSACVVIGQTPSTAFPVCGVDTFSQKSVPLCSSHKITVPGCPDALAQGGYTDLNPFWYEFTCYVSGTLGFLITPNNLGDDYDWQLYDITGHNPNDVFTDSSLIVIGNWSGTYGLTGASGTGVNYIQCASVPADDAPTFAKMPMLIKGHTYLLLISHYTDTQSGYKLTFGGGTASITDPTIPKLAGASINCDATTIAIKLSKKVTCISLDSDGSDFKLSSGLISIVSANGVNCNDGFDFDSLLINLSAPLPIGNYLISVKTGNDLNTLLDDCHNSVPVGDSAQLAVLPLAPTPFDSIVPVGCSPGLIQLFFQKPIQCASIAGNGSDFVISGTGPVTIVSASGICDDNDQTQIINLTLSSPIFTTGSYQIKLVTGTDGNTIIDQCNQETPAGQSVPFQTKDTVSASFSYQTYLGCKFDSIQFSSSAANGISTWQWTIDSSVSTVQNPLIVDSILGNKSATLIVSNGSCSDTSNAVVQLNNGFTSTFNAPDTTCPTDKVNFVNTSMGDISGWFWDFGDGTNSQEQTPPPHQYPDDFTQTIYQIRLITSNALGCYDTTVKLLTKLKSCYIAVPNAFTPNGDGHNDFLYPLNAFHAENLEFRVYNR